MLNRPKRMEVKHKGRRYWVSRGPYVGWYSFWSDHKWPFYHGHFQGDDPDKVWEAFVSWLPFKLEQE